MLRIRKTRAVGLILLDKGSANPTVMGYHFCDRTGDIAVTLTGTTRDALFASAADAFTDTITALSGVEPRRPEEVDLAAPELDLLLVDFLSELLYRFDTRRWLTREAQLEIGELDGGWALVGTLRGERLDEPRHHVKAVINAVTYHCLEVTRTGNLWQASVVFDV